MPVRSAAALVAATALLGAADPAPLPAAPGSYPLPEAIAAGWQGKPVCEVLFETAEMRSARCTFPPGVGHERHFHPRHWGYVVQGTTMRITDQNGTSDRVLASGTSWWSDGVTWHEAINIGATTAVYIIVEPKDRAR